MKVSEELHTIGNLHVTRVSAELKMARSLVRVADIQATLQEQRYGLLSRLFFCSIISNDFCVPQDPILKATDERAGRTETAQSFYVGLM